MNPVPMKRNTIPRFRWVLVVVAAALLIVPLAIHAQSGLAAPADLTATASDSMVTLSWTDPNNDAITKYQISTDGGSNFINILCDANTTGDTVTGLTNGTTYTFQVRAYDNSGPGPSATVTATPLLDAPTTLEAWPGAGYVQLRWDESTDSRVSGYEVRVSSDGVTGTYSRVKDQGHEEATFGYSVYDLTNGTNYTIKVRAVNGAAATLNRTPVIPALSRLEATPGYGRVTLSWRDREDDRIERYQFSSDDGANYTSVEYDSDELISYSENNRDFLKYKFTGLTNGTLYTFKVRTANSGDTVIGAEAPPEAEDPLTATPLFAAPSNLTAAPGDEQVTLNWDDPENTEISKYQLKIGTGDFADIPSSGATTTSHTVDNLTNYMSYTFELRAYDSNAAGPSALLMAYPVAGPTAPPDNLQATPGGGQVTLTWDDPGNAAITGYEVSSDGGANYSAISGSSASTTGDTVLNLTNFTSYWFTVRAVNASGAGAPSKARFAEPGTVPGFVNNLTATPKHERVELIWVKPTVRTAGYEVRYKKTNDNTWGDWVQNWVYKEATIDKLENGTSYDFAVRGYNYIGDGAISELTASPVATVPLAPTNFVAARGDGEVTLTWTDTRDDEVITNYYISSDDGTNYTDIRTNVSDSGTTTVSYTVLDLTNGTAHTFKVKAQNSAGTGPPPDPGVTETPLFAAPKGLQASPGGGQVTLTWDDPGNDDINGYEVSSDNGTNYTPISGSDADTAEHTVTGLTGGTERTFAVRAVNGVAATVKQTPLFASPAGLSALVGDQQITLNWTDPGNSAISGYEISSDGGDNYTPISGSGDTTNSHVVQNLSNGTEYSFAVRAVNCPANGVAAMVGATPLFNAPTGLSATAGNEQATLTWDDPDNSDITGYEVSSDGGANYNTITDSDSDPTTISHTVTGLIGGTSYTFAVRAVNGAPAMESATPLFAAPAGLSAEAGDGQVKLSWDDPVNSSISGYELSIDGGEFAAIGGSDASTTGDTVDNLSNGTAYSFAVRAVNASGEGASSDTVSATPLIAAPTGLTAEAGDGQVKLSWDDPVNSDISGYEVSSNGGTNYSTISGSDANTTGDTVTGLTNGTTYSFAVRAVNGAAAMVDATPLAVPAKPTTFAAAPGGGEVRLSWDDPGNSSISGYELSIDGGEFAAIGGSDASTTGDTVDNLSNGTAYSFAVRAVNASGEGASSDTVSATPLIAAPTGLTAEAGDGQVKLSWDDPVNSDISGYEVSSNGGTNYSTISGSDANTTGDTVTGLTNGTTYSFAVRAVNGAAAMVDATPLAVPAKPTTFAAAPGDGEVRLSWDDPGNSSISGYELSIDGGEFAAIGGSDASTTGDTVDNLSNGTAYSFAVRAVNASGEGASSDTVSATPLIAAPTGLTAEAGDGQVKLSWDDPVNSDISGYEVSSNGGTNYSTIGGSDANTTGDTVTGLTNGTTYSFAVRAVNGAAAMVDATPLAVPAKPTTFAAAPGDGEVRLSWDDPVNSSISGYELSIDGGEFAAIGGSDASTTGDTVDNLSNGTAYSFAVRAVNASGEGASSDTVSATPLIAAPTGLTAEAGDGQVKLSWDDPVNSDISGYEVSSNGGTNYSTIGGSDANTTGDTVTGLTNGTTYSFAVRAVNGAAAMVDATPLAVPAKPTTFAAAPGDGEVRLSWDDPVNSSISGYELSIDGGEFAAIGGSDASTTGDTVDNLSNGTAYSFAVRAVNASGEGASSDTVSATPLIAAPTGLTAEAGDGQVKLSWDDPVNSDISGYEVSSNGGTNYSTISGSDANTTGDTVTGLTNGTTYSFAVRAVNGAAAMVDATPLAVPAKPTTFAAAPGDGEVRLSWDDPVNSSISGYELSIDGGEFAAIGGSDASTTGDTVDNLSNGTAYSFAVRAVNASGEGASSDTVSATPLIAAPTGLTAEAGDGQVKLSWDDPVNSDISGYEVSSNGGTNYSTISGSDANTTGDTVTGLTNGTTYSFAVRAVNGASAMVDATPLAVPAKPTTFAAAPGDGEVRLSWDDPVNSSISGYELSIDGGEFAAIGGSDASTTGDTVDNLSNGTAYSFAVRAVNASGEGASSDTVSATPLAALMVSFGASNYEATEGGNDARVTVNLSALADRALTIPITTEPTGGDFALSETRLSFAEGDQTKIITVGARDDADLDDEQVVLGFVMLPEYVGEGSQSTTTVKLKDKGQEEAPPPPPPVPGRPRNLTATADDGAVALSWTTAVNNGRPIIKYQYRRSGVGWEDVPGGPTSTEVTISGLTNGVEYVFYARAVSSAGNGSPASVRVTPAAAPHAPGDLTAMAHDGAIALTWTAAEDNGSPIIKYQHQRDDSPWADIAGGATANSLTVTGLVNDTRYTFSARAVNGMGEGAVASVTAAPQAVLADSEPGETPVPTPEPPPTPEPKEETTDDPTATPEPTRKVVMATPEPTRKVVMATPEPTQKVVMATPEPTQKVVMATPEPTQKVVMATPTPEPTRTLVLTATMVPLSAGGAVAATPTAAPVAGPTPQPTATQMPALRVRVTPTATIEPAARPTATPAGTPLKEVPSQIMASPLVPVGIGLLALLIAALAAFPVASRRRR